MPKRLIEEITVKSQFNGPPASGNGGYVAGMIARSIDGAAEVALKAPPPLDKALILYETNDGLALLDGDTPLAFAAACDFDLEVPAMPEDAALGEFPDDATFKPFGECYVCGSERTLGDGLCIYAKLFKAAGLEGMVAADWTLTDNLKRDDGTIDPVYIWSALDCPGYAACAYGEPALLARMRARILRPLAGETARVLGWTLGSSGRKRMCGTAVYDGQNELVAYAEALWVVVQPEQIVA